MPAGHRPLQRDEPWATPKFRISRDIPCSRLSLTFSHAALVVDGSARGLNEASTVFAL